MPGCAWRAKTGSEKSVFCITFSLKGEVIKKIILEDTPQAHASGGYAAFDTGPMFTYSVEVMKKSKASDYIQIELERAFDQKTFVMKVVKRQRISKSLGDGLAVELAKLNK